MTGRGRPKKGGEKDSSIKIDVKSKNDEEEEDEDPVSTKMEQKSDSVSVTQIVKETTDLAKDIQTTKEVLGNIVYTAFFNLGLTPAEMVALLTETINYMIEDYKKYADLKNEHEAAIGLLETILAEFNRKKLTIDLMKQYQTDCVTNGVTPDIKYITSLLSEGVIVG
ncbi:MAG: hypothetical protein QXL94_00110 [Candidatus Parvarchaeum sp.]